MAVLKVEDIFSDVLERAKTLDPVNARKWFDELAPVHFDAGLLQIGCPDHTMAEFLKQNSKTSFTRAAQQITGHLVAVDFCVIDEPKARKARTPAQSEPKLHPDYTFANFVVGPSNRLAHASCVAVSRSPGNTYNPLFLYGNSGLGKTHLLHAICRDVSQHYVNISIQVLSCEDYVNRFINAIEQGNLPGFQRQFRSVDMLVIDDVQFLSERESSQNEFFHTFNSLYHNSKQIILSSDCAPSKISNLEERLVSRFNCGLVTRIDPPSHDTRVAIVKKKANLRGLDISEQVADYIAKKAQSNIREIEGALTAIYAVANTTGSQITLDMAKAALNGQIESPVKQISIADIVEVVTTYYNVRLCDLQSKKRSQSITLPRQVCMFLARSLTHHSLEEIGGHFGGRDHTTVMHACDKIEEMKKTDHKFKAVLAEFEKNIAHQAKA